MTAYNMLFLSDGQTHNPVEFEADEDTAAIRIARILYYMCSDTCESFELWQGMRQLRAAHSRDQEVSLADLVEAHQRVTLEKEDQLSRSQSAIAQSKRLIETLELIKKKGIYR